MTYVVCDISTHALTWSATRAIVVQGDTLSEPCIVGYPAERVFYTPAKMGLSL